MSDWYFSEMDNRLLCPEQIVQLTPKAAAVLACLQRYQGEVVGIQTFLDEVWPETHVTPDLVREYIHDLRTALGDDARQPRFVETVRGKGFRLIGKIGDGASFLAASGSPGGRENHPTVAILRPLVNGGSDVQGIADGVASEIINHLARFHYVGVVARQSSFSTMQESDIRAFARDLNADYVLESNLTQLGGTIRARFQLIDAETGRYVWGERFDLEGPESLAMVDDVSNAVVLALTGWHGELHRAEHKSVARKREGSLNAFEHFILGCDLELKLDAENLSRSIHHLRCSVKLDPTFSRAWLVLALELRWAYAVIPGRDRAYLAQSAEAFETAFNLAPGDPVNLALMAMNVARLGRLENALEMLERAEATMIGDSDAIVCVATSKSVLTADVDAACATFETVRNANTALPSWVHFAEACIAFMAGRYERCIICSRSGPQEISALVFRCLSHAMLGHEQQTRLSHDDLMTSFPEISFERFADNFPIADPSRRREYDLAVEKLRAVLEQETADEKQGSA